MLTQKSHISTAEPLVCRPKNDFWVLLGFWGLTGLGFSLAVIFFSPRAQSAGEFWGFLGVIAVFFALPVLLGAWWMRGHGLVADARGLTFFGFHRRRFVAWNEVEDFELRLPNSNQSKLNQPPAYLKSGGKWRHLSQVLSHHDELLEIIAREATSAKAKSCQLAETRDDGEWPKTYQYRDVSGWRFFGKYLLLSFLLSSQFWIDVLFKGTAPFVKNIGDTWEFLPFWGRVGLVALPLLLCGSLPLIHITPYFATLTRRRFLGQKIVATRDGISLFRNSRQTALRWDEITSYHLETLPGHFQPTLCVVEAPNQRIEFVTGIEDTKPLQELIKTRAKSASTTQWLHQHGLDDDVLGGAASYYRGERVGDGPKIHHYRTRTNRAMLVFGLILSLGCLAPLVTGHRNNNGIPTTRADVAMGLFFLCCVAVPTLMGVWGWLRSSLCCEEDGLRQRSIWGERFLRWDEIEKLVFNGYYSVVSGRSRTLRFGIVADCEGLWAQIEKRSGVEHKRDSNAV